MDNDVVLGWADADPDVRYPRLAWHVQMFEKQDDETSIWSPEALVYLERSPDFSKLLDVFLKRMRPTSYTGSLADILEDRANLLNALPVEESNRPLVDAKSSELRTIAEQERQKEAGRNRQEYQSFE